MSMHPFAVVPILTTAGAALAPTIVAAIVGVLAVAFKPWQWARLARQRPRAAAGLVAALVLTAAAIWFAARPAKRNAAAASPSSTTSCDWADVARRILALEQARAQSAPAASNNKAKTAPPAPTLSPTASPTTQPVARGLGRDFRRVSYDGGPSPIRLKPLWSFRPEGTMFLSTPLVDGNRVYAAGCQSELGGYTGLLACLDLDSGKPLWQATELGEEPLRPFFSSPALSADGKSLVIGQGLHADRDCALLCFDAQTGRRRWEVKTTLHIESSPAIFGDVAVVGAGAIEGPDGRPVGDPGFVLAVRVSDGKELWRHPVNDPESSPAVDEQGIVYIGSGFNGNAVAALRSDSDERLRQGNLPRLAWRTPVAVPLTCAVSLCGELVLAAGGNSDVVHSNANARGVVLALARKTGAIRWQTPMDDAVLGPIACGDDTAFCTSRTGEVVALALADGQVRWRARVNGKSPLLAGCAFTGRRLYTQSSDGYLAVLDPKDGSVLEKLGVNDAAKAGSGLSVSTPQVAGGRVLVGSETGGLRCFVGAEAAP